MRNVKKNLIIGYARGGNKWAGLAKALEDLGQEATVVLDNFDQIEGNYDQIWTMAESLLPIQAELDKRLMINNISEKAADILSDKKKMDDFCSDNNLQSLIPKSIIPTCLKDLEMFKSTPFIVKPIIGSGTKKNYDTDIAYISYKNTADFMSSVPCDLVFRLNDTGWPDKAFNNRINRYMFQEHLYHKKCYSPYVYVNEYSEINYLFWVEGNIQDKQLDDLRFTSRPVDFMMIRDEEVPGSIIGSSAMYFETIVEELGIKNMFFSGPDFYYDDHLPTKVIDCNPRIGQGLQILNEVHGHQILPNIIKNTPIEFKTMFWWVPALVRPGKIKSVKDMSHLKEFFTSTNPEIRPGVTIPEFYFAVESGIFKIMLKIPGKNKPDMHNTYQAVSKQIQDCIEYED